MKKAAKMNSSVEWQWPVATRDEFALPTLVCEIYDKANGRGVNDQDDLVLTRVLLDVLRCQWTSRSMTTVRREHPAVLPTSQVL